MTTEEIKEAVRKWNESTELHNVNWVHTLGDFAEEYLKIEGWPEKKPLIAGKLEDIWNKGFNEALRLCKLAAMKENIGMKESRKEA